MIPKILIIGAVGQIGTELTQNWKIIAYWKRRRSIAWKTESQMCQLAPLKSSCADFNQLNICRTVHQITDVHLMVALFSVTAENPAFAGIWIMNFVRALNFLKPENQKYFVFEYCGFRPTTL